MSLRLYMDHNVHGAITAGLRHKSIDVITAGQDGRRFAPDPVLLTRATELQRLFFTHDNDLLGEAHRRQLANEPFSGLVYAHKLRVTIGQAIDDLSLICEVYEIREIENQVLYLPI